MDTALSIVAVALVGSAIWFVLQLAAWWLVIKTEAQARHAMRYLRAFAVVAVLLVAAINLILCIRDESVSFTGIFGTAIALGWVFLVAIFAINIVGSKKKRKNEN